MSKRGKLIEGSGFEGLANFKSSAEFKDTSSSADQDTSKTINKTEPVLEQMPVINESPLVLANSKIDVENSSVENELNAEDEKNFNRVIQLINVGIQKEGLSLSRFGLASKSGNSHRYFRIMELFKLSHKCDVENFIQHHNLRREANMNQEIGTIFDALLLRGFRSQAISWLRSLTVEGLKYGSVPGKSNPTSVEKRLFRIEEARKFSEKAGTKLEILAAENNLGNLLNG